MRTTFLAVAFVGWLSACPGYKNVQCLENGHCDNGAGGVCVAAATGNTWCAYPDPACSSGYRYSDVDTGDGVAGVCVADDSLGDGGVDGPPPPGSWGKHIPGPGFESVGAIAVAGDGSVFITGTFDETLDLGGGPLNAGGTPDIFLAKFTADGAHVWSQQFSGGGDSGGTKLSVLSNGDLALGGNFTGSLVFGATTLNSAGMNDVFVARLSGTGNPIWAHSGGTAQADELYDLSVDELDNIAVCGRLDGAGTFFGANLNGSYSAWVARLTNAGDHSWSRVFGSPSTGDHCGVASMMGGDVVVAGEFNGTLNAGGSAMTSSGATLDMFVARYVGASGAHVWSAPKGTAGQDSVGDVEPSGTSIVTTGRFSGTTTFGGADLVSAGGDDAFVAKFDASTGAHQFSTRIGGTSQDSGQHLSIRSDGQISVAGLFAGTVNFEGTTLTSNGDFDPFVIDLDGASLVGLSVKSVGGVSRDEAYDVASTSTTLLFAGSFASSITVIGQTYTSMGFLDGYLVRYKR